MVTPSDSSDTMVSDKGKPWSGAINSAHTTSSALAEESMVAMVAMVKKAIFAPISLFTLSKDQDKSNTVLLRQRVRDRPELVQQHQTLTGN